MRSNSTFCDISISVWYLPAFHDSPPAMAVECEVAQTSSMTSPVLNLPRWNGGMGWPELEAYAILLFQTHLNSQALFMSKEAGM